jgi:hypothetical protein
MASYTLSGTFLGSTYTTLKCKECSVGSERIMREIRYSENGEKNCIILFLSGGDRIKEIT